MTRLDSAAPLWSGSIRHLLNELPAQRRTHQPVPGFMMLPTGTAVNGVRASNARSSSYHDRKGHRTATRQNSHSVLRQRGERLETQPEEYCTEQERFPVQKNHSGNFHFGLLAATRIIFRGGPAGLNIETVKRILLWLTLATAAQARWDSFLGGSPECR
jgi:hypothetical protein